MSKTPEPAVPPDVTSGLQPITPSNPPEIPLSPNPWEEEESTLSKRNVESATKAMPLPVLDCQSFDDVKTDVPPPKNDMSKVEILNEFDPLVSIEEKAARDAWADSEGHPPPPPRTPSPPVPPMKDLYISSPASPEGPSHIASPGPSATAITSPTPFASIASFAKNFALPIVKTRPQSFDESAKGVAPPSSLPNEQDSATLEVPDRRSSASGSSTPNRGGDETKPSDATFDFQIFLDQMKTRSAEPVSRYLRS